MSISNGSVVSTSQIKGDITINNCSGAAIFVNGENLASSNGNTNITNATIQLENAEYTYDGNAKQPYVKVTINGKELVKGRDFVPVYSNNTDAGKALVTIYGIGEYTGIKETTFNISNKKLSAKDFKIDTSASKYTGKYIKKKIFSNLKEGKDYKVSYANNKNPGRAAITITGKGDYTGKVTKTFIIKPGKVSKLNVTAVKGGKAKVSWKKQTGVTGYEILYSGDKMFKKNKKTVKVNKTSSAKTISKLTKRKKYYFKVRSYKTISGKKVYGDWCSAKSISVK